jgi:hypothetical protein
MMHVVFIMMDVSTVPSFWVCLLLRQFQCKFSIKSFGINKHTLSIRLLCAIIYYRQTINHHTNLRE